MTLVHSALAGGEWIDDVDRLRAGATGAVLGHRVAAPSTLGTFLRSFTWGSARQLDQVAAQALCRAWQAGAGPGPWPLTIDVDSTHCETYGLQKQGATGVDRHGERGYHPLLATVAGTGDVLHSRLRDGVANSSRGAASFVTEAINRTRRAGASGPITLRADSGFYTHKVIDACRKQDVTCSITVKVTKAVRQVIRQIPEQAWTPIPYWLDDGADIAETSYRPFGRKGRVMRLIVRRVRPTPGSRLALCCDYDYHPFVTDRQGSTLELEADHRRHAEVENTIPRPQVRRRPQPPAQREVRRQRRLAHPGRHRAQPGPLGLSDRAGRAACHHQDPPGPLPGPARPADPLGPPVAPAPAHPLALAAALSPGIGPAALRAVPYLTSTATSAAAPSRPGQRQPASQTANAPSVPRRAPK
jgi:Transposase DDE domain group 1